MTDAERKVWEKEVSQAILAITRNVFGSHADLSTWVGSDLMQVASVAITPVGEDETQG